MLKSVIDGQRVVVSSSSLQSDEVVVQSKNKSQKMHYAVVPTPAKLTLAEYAAARDAQAIADLRKNGGIVAFGAWQTGAGNYKKARAVPAGAAVWWAHDVRYPHMKCPTNVCEWFAEHPRAKRCVAIVEAAAA
jgi:hypothetical protein